MNTFQIKSIMDTWAKNTYAFGLKRCLELQLCDEAEYKQTQKLLDNFELSDKYMTGDSVMGFNFYEKENIPIRFTEVFADTVSTNSPVTGKSSVSPASYILFIVKAFNKLNCLNESYLNLLIPRGLRAFPSFIREYDLCEKLKACLKGASCRRSNPTEDMSDHSDLYLCYNGKEYKIWSYLQTLKQDKLQNTISKVRGNRGPVSQGLHILCPITVNNKESYRGWWLYPLSYASDIKDIILQEKIDKYADILRLPDMDMYVQEPHVFQKSGDFRRF